MDKQYAILVERFVAVPTGSRAKFELRKANVKQFGVVGPFRSRQLAERSLSRFCGTVGFIRGQIVTHHALQQLSQDTSFQPFDLLKAVTVYLKTSRLDTAEPVTNNVE